MHYFPLGECLEHIFPPGKTVVQGVSRYNTICKVANEGWRAVLLKHRKIGLNLMSAGLVYSYIHFKLLPSSSLGKIRRIVMYLEHILGECSYAKLAMEKE